MKTRTDFVSNSSSSSFIFSDDFIRDFDLCKADLIEALVDLYSKEKYDAYVKANGHSPFVLYDMKHPDEATLAHADYDELLDHWDCERLHYDNNDKKYYIDDGRNLNRYMKILDSFENVFNLNLYGTLQQLNVFGSLGRDNQIQKLTMFTWAENHTCKKYINAPQCIKDTIAMIRAKLGILTNKDVLYRPFAQFLLHFDKNEVDELQDMTTASRKEDKRIENDAWDVKHNQEIESSIFDTDSYSFERFCEVLYNWLLAHGKISASAVQNGDQPFRLVADSICACTMHEG